MLRQLRDLLSPSGRSTVYWVLTAFLIQGITEVVGVVSVLPFLALASDPEQINTHHTIHQAYLFMGWTSPRSFIAFTGLLALFTLGAGNLASAITTRSSVKFCSEEQTYASARLLESYLSRPYEWFLEKNMSVQVSHVLWEMSAVYSGVLLPLLRIVSRLVVLALISLCLIVVDPVIALATTVILGGTYYLVYALMKSRLGEIGRQRLLAEALRTRSASEALHGAKVSIVLGREHFFLTNFTKYSTQTALLNTEQGSLQELPRYLLETLAFGGVICTVLMLIYQGRDVKTVLPILGVFTLAAYRLMPALQQIFSFVSIIRLHIPLLNKMHAEAFANTYNNRTIKTEQTPLPLNRSLDIVDLRFTYPGVNEAVLKGIDLSIEKNTTVAFVGSTGAGKTTLVDLLLGLLTPQQGVIYVDGVPLTSENLGNWQRNIGYVSQESFLLDDTITANIAFAINPSEVKMEQVERASKIANLHDFVLTLPAGYKTVVGDRGVRLSGGQRQRIAIARALYRDPDVLILDEATSSLDGVTENAVMDAVRSLANKKTIILIAHRLTTVMSAKTIYFLGQGRVLEKGTYQEMMDASASFRAMAQAGGERNLAATNQF